MLRSSAAAGYAASFLAHDLLYSDEYSPVFYDPNVIKPTATRTHWLNSDGTEGRLATEWGAGCVRIVTSLTFMWDSDQETTVFNTHFDHVSDPARAHASRKVRSLLSEQNGTVFLTGDFNTYVGSEAWYVLNSTLADTFFTSEAAHDGPLRTFHNWEDGGCGRAIDWVFASRNISVLRRGSAWSERASDHNAVEVVARLDGGGRREDWKRRFSDC